jgi:hypothetical protein
VFSLVRALIGVAVYLTLLTVGGRLPPELTHLRAFRLGR